MTAIVGVHGVRNFDPAHSAEDVAAALSSAWAEVIAKKIGIEPGNLLSVAYYAPFLNAGQPVAHAGTVDPDRELDRIDRAGNKLDQMSKALTANWLAIVEPSPNVTPQGRLTVPLRVAVSFVAKRRGLPAPALKLLVARFFPEVARYLDPKSPARTKARDHVADTIRDRQARIVIAHSLGTVVAYEALHEHELEIDLLVTLGSPLAMPGVIFDSLQPEPEGGTGLPPPGVARWVNISDHGDPIAIPPPFKKYFPDVDEDLTESIAPFEFHKVVRYLAADGLAANLRPLLRSGNGDGRRSV